MNDLIFELGDIGILLALWLTLGGELAVIAYLIYAATGLALERVAGQKE